MVRTAPNHSSSLVDLKPNSSYSLRSNNQYLLSNPDFRTLPGGVRPMIVKHTGRNGKIAHSYQRRRRVHIKLP